MKKAPSRKRDVFAFLFATIFLASFGEGPLQAHTIRCADPKCPLCLREPGSVSPSQEDSREPRGRPENAPFGLPASPAVVHPILRSSHQDVLSLSGDWEFTVDPEALGVRDNWMEPGKTWDDSRTMPVPGNWESHGLGEPGMSTPWICSWDCTPRPLRNIYIGSAWYRKSFPVPEDWKGKRIWLKIGGVRAQGWFWINGKPVAKAAPYCGTFRFEITAFLVPGEDAVLVAQIRNDVPSRTGLMSACHIWGGIHRDIEIEATPQIHLSNVECFGNFDEKRVDVRVELSHENRSETETERSVDLQLDLRAIDSLDRSKAGPILQSLRKRIPLQPGSTSEASIPVSLEDFRPWSPESPHLYRLEVKLLDAEGKNVVHGWTERFGVKKLEVRGNRFFLNDKPYFLRGYGDDFMYPETFISPVDREVHRKNLGLAREAGFNFVRLHTHCEIPEYYEVADELGIMVQAELPYYPFNGHHTTELFDFDPMRDLDELIEHYRRYVSLSVYCMGNEGHLGTPLDHELKERVGRRDPGRLVHHNDGGVNTPENSDFESPNTACWPRRKTTTIVPWEPGAFADLQMPFIAHEYLNLGIKFDPRISERFTGAMLPPRPLDRYEKRLADLGLDRRWGDACLDGAHALQKHYQKAGIEAARLDPDCDGYNYWTLVDVIVKFGGEDDFTGQGMFNPFHEPKSNGTTPRDVAKFNSPTAILLKSDREHPIFVEGESVRFPLWISHFGNEDLENARLRWTLRSDSEVLASGKLENLRVRCGDVKSIALAHCSIPIRGKAESLVFEAKIEGTEILNDWPFWVFPKREKKNVRSLAASPDLIDALSRHYTGLLTLGTPEAESAEIILACVSDLQTLPIHSQNKRILLLGEAGGPPNVRLGWWWIGDQVGTAFANHPAFGDFPHDGFISPLWFRLIKRGLPIRPQMSMEKLEFLGVGEGRNDYFLYVGQTATKDGAKILATFGLDLTADTPEGIYLLDRMIEYISSDRFEPGAIIDPHAFLENLKTP